MAKDKFPGSPVSLDALCKRYRVDNSKRTQHTALIDCGLLAKIYINLIDQKEPMLNFQNQEQEVKEKNNSSVDYFKKIITPTLEELKKHKDYLKNNLKNNFFNWIFDCINFQNLFFFSNFTSGYPELWSKSKRDFSKSG